MKKILAYVMVTACSTALSLAQGTVNFDTSSGTIGGTGARILEAEGQAAAGVAIGNTAGGSIPGSQFLMQLFAAAGSTADSASLIPVGIAVNSRGGVANGSFSQVSGTTSLGAPVDSAVLIPFLTAGGPVTLQLRCWWAGANGATYATWEAAIGAASDPLSRWGASALLNLATTGNPSAQPPGTPVNLVGLEGFTLAGGTVIPEPTSMALAGLGAASLLIFRRRK